VSEHPRKTLRERIEEASVAAIGGALAIVIGAVVVAFLLSGGGSNKPGGSSSVAAPGSVVTGGRLTVEDIRYHGTWELTSPNAIRLLPRTDRPADARQWVPEGTNVTVACAGAHTAYAVINKGRQERWRWWAHLTGGGWVAMAAFKQTTTDGSQGFETC
jgi:hypothetical protein